VKKKKKKGWSRDQKLALVGILLGVILGITQIVLAILPLLEK
jgi:hypothetical protein